MMLHAVCFCVKIVPESVKHETNVVTLPIDEFDNCDNAWNFIKEALADFLPENVEIEDKLTLLDDDNTEHGFFFSCSDAQSDNHYHAIVKYLFF